MEASLKVESLAERIRREQRHADYTSGSYWYRANYNIANCASWPVSRKTPMACLAYELDCFDNVLRFKPELASRELMLFSSQHRSPSKL